jgi:hypothetical protein
MKKIYKYFLNIKNIFKLFIFGFHGNESPSSDLPVTAGIDAIVKFNGRVIAYATNVSFNEDFELQGIRTLGYHGDRK